jgi:hypothetical protein
MIEFLIWTINPDEMRSAFTTLENREYMIQVLEHDPNVKEYSIVSL